jgi:hypothetical protein
MAFACSCYGTDSVGQLPEKDSTQKTMDPYYDNPLKGLDTFVFFTQFPADAKTIDKINTSVKDVLSSFGKVVPSSLLVQTKEGEAIDVKCFATGATLIYEITNLVSLDGKNLGLKATLSLRTLVEVESTKRDCSPYVWSKSCFLKGELGKKTEESVTRSLQYLLDRFSGDYSLVNTKKPTFNLYQS